MNSNRPVCQQTGVVVVHRSSPHINSGSSSCSPGLHGHPLSLILCAVAWDRPAALGEWASGEQGLRGDGAPSTAHMH